MPGQTGAVFLDPMEVQDIDPLEDWELADLKFQKMVQNKKREHL